MALLGEGPDMPTRYPPQSLRVDRVVQPANLSKTASKTASKRTRSSARAARPRATRGRGR